LKPCSRRIGNGGAVSRVAVGLAKPARHAVWKLTIGLDFARNTIQGIGGAASVQTSQRGKVVADTILNDTMARKWIAQSEGFYCQSCGFGPVRVWDADSGPPNNKTGKLCLICRRTKTGNAFLWPGHYGEDSVNAMQTIAVVGNMIMAELQAQRQLLVGADEAVYGLGLVTMLARAQAVLRQELIGEPTDHWQDGFNAGLLRVGDALDMTDRDDGGRALLFLLREAKKEERVNERERIARMLDEQAEDAEYKAMEVEGPEYTLLMHTAEQARAIAVRIRAWSEQEEGEK
jgi:hypothetical protein